MNGLYEVTVANIGSVHSGTDPAHALEAYYCYIELIRNGQTRGEWPVTLWYEGEIDEQTDEGEIDEQTEEKPGKMTRNGLTFLGWGLVGEPQKDVIAQTGDGPGIDVTGYHEGDYWDGLDASAFKGPDAYGIVPVYEMPDGSIFPAGAKQYPYNA